MRITDRKPQEWIDQRSPINKQILFCLSRGDRRLIKDLGIVRNFDFSNISSNEIGEIVGLALNSSLDDLTSALGNNQSLRNKIAQSQTLRSTIRNGRGNFISELTEDPVLLNLIHPQQPKPATNPQPQRTTHTTTKSGIPLRGGIGESRAQIHTAHSTPPPPKATDVNDVVFGGRINNIAIKTHSRRPSQASHSGNEKAFILEPGEQVRPREISLFDLQIEKVISIIRQTVIRSDSARGRTPFFLRAESLSSHDLHEEFKSLSPLSHYIDLAKDPEYKDLRSIFEFGKSEDTLNPHNIRPLIEWAKEHPNHNFSLGIACNPNLTKVLRYKELIELREWANTEENRDKNISKCLIIALQNISQKRQTHHNNGNHTNDAAQSLSDGEMISLYELLALRTPAQATTSTEKTELKTEEITRPTHGKKGPIPIFIKLERLSVDELKRELESVPEERVPYYFKCAKDEEYANFNSAKEFGKLEKVFNSKNKRVLIEWAQRNSNHFLAHGIALNTAITKCIPFEELIELKIWAKGQEGNTVASNLLTTLKDIPDAPLEDAPVFFKKSVFETLQTEKEVQDLDLSDSYKKWKYIEQAKDPKREKNVLVTCFGKREDVIVSRNLQNITAWAKENPNHNFAIGIGLNSTLKNINICTPATIQDLIQWANRDDKKDSGFAKSLRENYGDKTLEDFQKEYDILNAPPPSKRKPSKFDVLQRPEEALNISFDNESTKLYYARKAKTAEYADSDIALYFAQREDALSRIHLRNDITWAKSNPNHKYAEGIVLNERFINLLIHDEKIELSKWASDAENSKTKFGISLIRLFEGNPIVEEVKEPIRHNYFVFETENPQDAKTIVFSEYSTRASNINGAKENRFKDSEHAFYFGQNLTILSKNYFRRQIQWCLENPNHNFAAGVGLNEKLKDPAIVSPADRDWMLGKAARLEGKFSINVAKTLNIPTTDTTPDIRPKPQPTKLGKNHIPSEEVPYISDLYNYLISPSENRAKINKSVIGFIAIKTKEAKLAIINAAKLDQNIDDEFVIRVGKILILNNFDRTEIEDLGNWVKENPNHSFAVGISKNKHTKILMPKTTP